MTQTDIIPSSSLFTPTDQVDANSLKFGLYLKTHEVKQVEQVLREVLLLPASQRAQWLEEYEDWMMSVMDDYIENSVMVMDGMHLDQEAATLSTEFVSSLRDMMTTLKSILNHSARQLQS